MPIATNIITEISRIEDLAEYWLNALEQNADQLGFEFVGGYDDPIKTSYPAVVVGAGNTTKEVHATHTFLVQLNLDFYICHAEATVTHRKRSLENLKSVTRLVAFLEADPTLGDKITFGYVIQERPGVIQPRTNPSKFIIGTVINYQATLEVRF